MGPVGLALLRAGMMGELSVELMPKFEFDFGAPAEYAAQRSSCESFMRGLLSVIDPSPVRLFLPGIKH